ncbi:helix-turn-helix domain-containing protein [Patescibacteria group bacterium]|nr:helix-turn-helix domain-containing protein [Patescibacteria group bacterium]
MATRILERLKKAGLSDKAAVVYEVLLERGGAYPSAIAKEARLNRSTTYKILLDLSVKGLVTEIKKGSKLYYQIEKPQKLVRFAKMRVEQGKEMQATAEELLPELEGLYSLVPNKPKITYFEGKEGMLSVYEDHVRVDEPYEMVAWANTGHLTEFFPIDFFKFYKKEKERIGISARGIVPDTNKDKAFIEEQYSYIDKKYWPKIKHIPAAQFPFKSEITVYGKNKVSILNLENKNYSGVIIEDPTIHQMMRMMFELSWNGVT